MAKGNNKIILYVVGGLVVLGVLYGMKNETGPDAQLIDCGMELTTFTGVMNVADAVQKYSGSEMCIGLIDQYVQNNQAEEYAKLVAAGEINEDQATASLTIDVETINAAKGMFAA